MLETETRTRQDPCLTQVMSVSRLAVLVALFLAVPGGGVLLILLADKPFGIQFSSIVMYTGAVALYTFSRNRNGNQPFLLSCPVVRGQVPRLIRRHLGFIAVVFMVETTALRLRPSLPATWITPSSHDASPFAILLGLICMVLAIAETLTNRSLLESAHDSAQFGDPEVDGTSPLH